MKNDAAYVLIDTASRVVLSVTFGIESAIFAQRNVLDSKVMSVPRPVWARIGYTGALVRLVEASALESALDFAYDQIIKSKRNTAMLLTEGHRYLMWYANLITERYWSTSSLDYDDMLMYGMDREGYTQVYADAKKIDYADAQKQLEFDMDNLRANALRRKQILWTYERELAAITNATQLQLFKDNVKRGTVEIGFV